MFNKTKVNTNSNKQYNEPLSCHMMPDKAVQSFYSKNSNFIFFSGETEFNHLNQIKLGMN